MQKTGGATFAPPFFQGKMKVFENSMVFSKDAKCMVFKGFGVATRHWDPIFKKKKKTGNGLDGFVLQVVCREATV